MTTPLPVDDIGSTAVALAGGDEGNECALRADGQVLCWTFDRETVGANPVSLPFPAVGIAVTDTHACAWSAAGALSCWGDNTYGVLGDGTTQPRNAPVSAILAPGPVQRAVVTRDQTCVQLIGDGSLWCWGWNGAGELGDGTGGARSLPVLVPSL